MDFRARDGQTAMHHAIRHGNQLALKVKHVMTCIDCAGNGTDNVVGHA